MPTVPATKPAREYPLQLLHYVRFIVNFNDPNVANAANSDPKARLPLGAYIKEAECEIITTFNAGTTNVLTVGTSTANANEIIAAGDVNEGVAAITRNITTGAGQAQCATAEKNIYAKYTQTGTAATQGKALIHVFYTIDNDG